MTIRSFIYLIILFGFGNCVLQANIPHAYIKSWQAGSWIDNYRQPLPGCATIDFHKPVIVTKEFSDKFIQFFMESISEQHIANYHGASADGYHMTVRWSVTREQLQGLIDQANHHFDPDFKTPQEIAAQQAAEKALKESEEKARKEKEEKLASEEALKKWWEKENLRLEAEQRAQEERRQKSLIESARIAAQLKEEQARKQAAFEAAEAKYKSYSVAELPICFRADLPAKINNRGQIAGTTTSLKAALWDSNKGILVLNLDAYMTFPGALNDKGVVVIDMQRTQGNHRTILWNSNTGETISGPQLSGLYAINNNNIVLIAHGGCQTTLWNPCDNTLNTHNGTYFGINDDGTLRSQQYCNMHGNVLTQATTMQTDLLLKCGATTYLLLPCEGEVAAGLLNDNNEVVSLINIKKGNDQYYAISKWDSNRKAARSRALQAMPELKDYRGFAIIGFNNAGQILLKAEKGGAAPQLFLLTPK